MLCDKNLTIVVPPYVVNGITYASDIDQTMSDAELAAIGLYKVIDEGSPADAFTKVVSATPARQADGTIKIVYVLQFVSTSPQSISKRQMFHQCVVDGDITWAEAMTFFKDGTLPAKFEAAFSQIPNDSNQQDQARFTFLSASTIVRHNPTTLMLQTLLGKTDTEMDAFFVSANVII